MLPAGIQRQYSKHWQLLRLETFFLERAQGPILLDERLHALLQDKVTSPLLRLVSRHLAAQSPPAHRAAAQAHAPVGSRSPAGRVADDLARVIIPIVGWCKISLG
jgi:hypothetical protein